MKTSKIKQARLKYSTPLLSKYDSLSEITLLTHEGRGACATPDGPSCKFGWKGGWNPKDAEGNSICCPP